jgi:CHAT domain-containing protein/Tfp pilus assembly protein PilF
MAPFWRTLGVGLLCVATAAGIDVPRPRPLTASQQARLKERNRYHAEARKLRAAGKLAEAVAAAEKMLDIEREVFGERHADVIESLELLAELHQEREDWPAALRARQDVLRLQTALLGAADWRVTNARLALADLEGWIRRPAAERAQLREAERLIDQVGQLWKAGQFRDALSPAQQSATTRKQLLGERHPDYAESLNALAVLYQDQGDYARAESLLQQGLAIRKQALGERHPDYASSLSNLATLYDDQGDSARAEPLCRQALAIRKQVVGERHPHYAASLNNLAKLYVTQGAYARAEPLFQQALALHKEVLGERHPDYASSLHNLAMLYWSQGDYAKAEPLYQQALAIRKQTHGERHPDYADSLNNLALVYWAQEDHAKAAPLLQQALAIWKQAVGERHPSYGTGLFNVAAMYQAQGDYAKAAPLLQQALALFKQTLGELHPRYTDCLGNLALLYQAQGDYARAEPLAQQALTLRKQTLGEHHPRYAESLHNLALLYWEQGNHARAESLSRQALSRARRLLDEAAGAQADRQQLAMADFFRVRIDAYLTVAPRAGVPAAEVYNAVLPWKGSIFARQQAFLRAGRQVAAAPWLQEWQRTTRQLATLALASPPPAQQPACREQLEKLTLRKEQLEVELARDSPAFRALQARDRLKAAQIEAVLPADAALVDFLVHRQAVAALNARGAKLEERLTAFVLRRGQPVVRVDLGFLEPLAAAIAAWRHTVREPRADAKAAAAATALRQRLWQPLAAHVAGARTLLVSPDGPLTGLPFAALPGSKPDTYLIEEVAVAVVPVPQLLPELLASERRQPPVPGEQQGRQPGTNAPRSPDPTLESLLLVGDVDFGAAPGQPVDASRSAARGGALPAYGRLAGTRQEVLAVRDSFERRFKQGKVTLLREDEATEAAVRLAAPAHRYLHLATHGFFAPPTLKSALQPDPQRARGDGFGLFDQQGVVGWHPGLLSGLVLAGANRTPQPGQDDGILTALEVAELDLSGVELAVLSACETGLGQVAGGEGLLGLQRAFQVAGARTVLASLWAVDDDATRALMVRFYENLWQKGLPKLEALRQAQLATLRGSGDRGEVRDRAAAAPARQPPYTWSAFVLSGDWR